jgi:N-acetylglucosamine-6-sulfatase
MGKGLFGAAVLALPAAIGAGARTHPNIVLFLQDDQDEFLGGWTPMVQADSLVASKGAMATNAFIHTPVCCPSRAELLSGRFFHNVRMPSPGGGCMHVDTNKVNPVSFATHLQREANYTCGWFGKHMNAAPHSPPPGFDCPSCYWFANGGGSDLEPGAFLNATFSDFAGGVAVPEGKYHKTNGVYRADTNGEFAGYFTSVIGNKSIAWVRQVAPGPQPFFVAVASKGPHVPSTPAPWYASAFSNDAAPRTPAYNASKEQLANHHWLIAQQGPITTRQGETIDELFRDRWRTLLSVDDAIASMVAALTELGVLESTYIIITSDHGYNLGQHRLPSCKLQVYDHAVRIPTIIRGPGIREGSLMQEPISNTDIAPTILALAGLDGFGTQPPMDGRSFAELVVDPSDRALLPSTRAHFERLRQDALPPWRTYSYIEYISLGNVTRTGHLVDDPESNNYRALRFTSGAPFGSGQLLYSEFTTLRDYHYESPNFIEIFDMESDPHQLVNLASQVPAAVKGQLHRMVKAKFSCSGRACEESLESFVV